jgi:hypothetical protein
MSWDLPAGLRPVHDLVASDAPWPRSDERPRLDAAGSWLDLAAAAQDGRAQADPAVAYVRKAGNTGDGVNVFEESYGAESQRMDDGFVANALVGTGTTAVVVFKTVWKYIVVLSLITLLLALIRGFQLGPLLGSLFARQRVLGTRKALSMTLAQVERNIGGSAVASLQLAKHMLARVMIVPALQAGAVAANALSLDPFDDNPAAREDAERVLEQTPEGRAALAYAREHGITTLYQSDRNMAWSDYDPHLNVIRIGASDTAASEALAGEFVRQVQMAKDRWDPSATGDFGAYHDAREAQEAQANQAAYRMGGQLGHEQDARETYLDGDYGAGYHKHLSDHENGLEQAILGGPFKLFNDGPLDFT